MTTYDDLNSKQIFVVGLVSTALTFISILAAQVLYFALNERLEAEKSEHSVYREGNSVLAAQTDEISSYGVDEETGNVQIPISEAIRLVAEEQAQDDGNDGGTDDGDQA